ncbi:hypothetical protein DIPPA_14653 [Diplonema papillatum]|nr:hypothetical protein DIPPA_14653 [Diplonema papillatum]
MSARLLEDIRPQEAGHRKIVTFPVSRARAMSTRPQPYRIVMSDSVPGPPFSSCLPRRSTRYGSPRAISAKRCVNAPLLIERAENPFIVGVRAHVASKVVAVIAESCRNGAQT